MSEARVSQSVLLFFFFCFSLLSACNCFFLCSPPATPCAKVPSCGDNDFWWLRAPHWPSWGTRYTECPSFGFARTRISLPLKNNRSILLSGGRRKYHSPPPPSPASSPSPFTTSLHSGERGEEAEISHHAYRKQTQNKRSVCTTGAKSAHALPGRVVWKSHWELNE